LIRGQDSNGKSTPAPRQTRFLHSFVAQGGLFCPPAIGGAGADTLSGGVNCTSIVRRSERRRADFNRNGAGDMIRFAGDGPGAFRCDRACTGSGRAKEGTAS
jgi:hypothetical protein